MPHHCWHVTRDNAVEMFPFYLNERARQWYTQNVGKVAADWEELRNKFCLAFYPLS